MGKRIVAISIDKVQTFLFEAVHAHVQERQMEHETLRKIMRSSHEISEGFFERIQAIFADVEITTLLSCSGVFIFSCDLSENELNERLNHLFMHYYCESQGQKQLRFVHFPAQSNSEIQIIQEAKRRLKSSKCMNRVIEKNADKLFSFQPVPEDSDFSEKNESPLFARELNKLHPPEQKNSIGTQNAQGDEEEEPIRFRIAVIKADLNGMGDKFKNINDREVYHVVSQTLNKHVSLKGLHQAAEAAWLDTETPWIFPLYVAGDDIFFAVAVENLIKGIDVCRKLVQIINEELPKEICKFSISIGVEIMINKLPIRYYAGMVENQLDNAKKACCPLALQDFLHAKISICELVFFDIDIKDKKEKKKELPNLSKEKLAISKAEIETPIWQYFMSDLKLLQEIQTNSCCKDKIGTTNFLYTLLARITGDDVCESGTRYFNHLLYHLLPEYLDSPNRMLQQYELKLKTAIIKQLYQKEIEGSREEKGDKIVLNCTTKHRLEIYIRLMLLFSDERFYHPLTDRRNATNDRENEDKKSIAKYLFQKPMNYLFENSLKGELENYFVKKCNYSKKGSKRSIPFFRHINIEKSMFFKIRDTQKVTVQKAAEMIALQSFMDAEKIQKANESRIELGKAPYHLYFDKDAFVSAAQKSGAWKPDYIDSMMLFFQYNEMIIQYKGMNNKNKKGGAK